MDQYITGAMIKDLRERKGLTQSCLAEILNVSDKAVSKWETGRGYPDVSLIEPLAAALGVSVIELFAGKNTVNKNRSFDMRRMKFYVCPVCGNVVFSVGEAVISCCGIVLPPLDAETGDDEHALTVEPVEDEYYVYTDHPMTKSHYISFIAAVYGDGTEIKKLYPEGNASSRFKIAGLKGFYYYCNRHGLYYSGRK